MNLTAKHEPKVRIQGPDIRFSLFRWMLAGADALGEREVKRKGGGEDRVSKYGTVGELPKFIEAFERVKRMIVRKLGDQTANKRARIHPLAIFAVQKIYAHT